MEYIEENLTLTQLRNFLNRKYKKKSGQLFSIGDVQGYIKRECLPNYLGHYKIEENDKIKGVKLYNVVNH